MLGGDLSAMEIRVLWRFEGYGDSRAMEIRALYLHQIVPCLIVNHSCKCPNPSITF